MLDLEAIKSVLINSIEPLREDNLIEDYDVFELDNEKGIGFAIKKSNKWEEQRITSISSLKELIEYLESIDLPFGSELYKHVGFTTLTVNVCLWVVFLFVLLFFVVEEAVSPVAVLTQILFFASKNNLCQDLNNFVS